MFLCHLLEYHKNQIWLTWMKLIVFLENDINGALKNSGRRKPGLQIMPELEIRFKQMTTVILKDFHDLLWLPDSHYKPLLLILILK